MHEITFIKRGMNSQPIFGVVINGYSSKKKIDNALEEYKSTPINKHIPLLEVAIDGGILATIGKPSNE